MSLFFAPVTRRGWTPEPPIPPNSQVGASYARVRLWNAESSLQKVAVWACVNLVRSIAETLPVDVFSGRGADKRPVRMPRFLSDPQGDGHGLSDWCGQVVYSLMLRGNVFGLVADRDAVSGRPTQIVLQHPDEVTVCRESSSGGLVWRVCGRLVEPGVMWHKRVNAVPGYPLGLSPIAVHALTIGVGVAAMRFGAQWFEDGAHPSGLLTYEQSLRENEAETAKARFLAAVRGTREPVVLGRGWQFKPIQLNPNESQFLETNSYTSAECCRIFGPALADVFGYETGKSGLTYSNIEQRSLDLLTYAADPWLVRLERMLSELLPTPQYVRFNRAALVKTDLLTRYRAHEIALANQWKVVNEVRDDEDLPPVPWGDTPVPPLKSTQSVGSTGGGS